MTRYDITLRYSTLLPDGYVEDFRGACDDAEVQLSEQEFEPAPFNAIEWVIPTAVAIYIAKPFIDAIIKRAADDFGNVVYPRLKNAIVNLAKKIYVRERLPLVIVTRDGPKEGSHDSVQFSICCETISKRRIKFVFTETYEEHQYEECINQVFAILTDHHRNAHGNDSLSQQIASLPNNRRDSIFLVYDSQTETWSVQDPVSELLEPDSQSDKAS